MGEKFVLLTDDNDTFADVTSDDIVRIRGGLKPSCDKIKWYTPESTLPEYYSKWQEYDRLDLSDGKANNDEVLDDGKYNPGTKYVIYGSLREETVMIRPSKYKEILAMVSNTLTLKDASDESVRQAVARLISKKLENPNIKYVICEIADMSDVIALEDIFAVIDSVDSVEHDILKNEIKLYVFDPHKIHHVTEEDKYKAYVNVKNRVESGFYNKKLEFLDMLRYDKTLEPKNRESYLRCGVLPKEGETAEECYDRIKSYLEQIYRDFERYKDDYEEFKGHILNKLPRAISTERNEWDVRYNDEVITSALVTGYVRFFSGLYISADAEMDICTTDDKRRRFRYNRCFQVTNLAIFNSEAMYIDRVIEIEKIRQKNIEERKKEEEKNI